MNTPRLIPLALIWLACLPGTAAANDSQAKPADLQKALQGQDARLARLESQLQNQGLLNLLNQVESLKAEIARLRGAQEELGFQQTAADKRAKELFADLDDRVKELETRPQAPTAPAPDTVRLQAAQALSKPVAAPPAATTTPPPASSGIEPSGASKAYEQAYNLVKAGRYNEAVSALQNFVSSYPNSSLLPNAHYWIGFSYVGMSDFANAGASFKHLIDAFPSSNKTADAMLSLARAQVQMNSANEAIATLEQLAAKFPYSKAAAEGKKLLSNLK